MDVPETGTVVSGVGNEIIVLIVSATVGIATLYMVWRMVCSERSEQNLHPDLVHTVQQTRNDMGVANEGVANEELEVSAENCPVCLGRIEYSVQTNCGHRFCAECVLEYWRHDQWPRPARCPVCRRTVSSPFTCYQNAPLGLVHR